MGSLVSLCVCVSGFMVGVTFVAIGHELGHLMVARLLRVPVKLIAVGLGPTLWQRSLGDDVRLMMRALPVGMTIGVVGRRDLDGRVRRPLEYDAAIAAAGPLANVLMTVALLMAALLVDPASPLHSWFITTAALSLLLAIFNLVPLPGLDGGHLLILIAARLGMQLSPQQEATLHRVGLRLTAVACAVFCMARILGVG
jgi:membrane-associated protease RseP (regulator of RpoE activity)